MSAEGEFFISVTGSIEYASFYDIDNVYCKYGYHFGPDWTVVRGYREKKPQALYRRNIRLATPAHKFNSNKFTSGDLTRNVPGFLKLDEKKGAWNYPEYDEPQNNRVEKLSQEFPDLWKMNSSSDYLIALFKNGIEEGLSQMSKRSCDARQLAVWNFPLDVAFKSINPQGWPQLILSIYGLDFFGHDVIRGYGVCHLPMTTGTHTKKVAVYVPQSSSILQQFVAWFSGRRPELIDPTILASGDGRELTRMISQGTVTVRFNVSMKDFFKLGYSNGQNR